jgi:hypothetical protein
MALTKKQAQVVKDIAKKYGKVIDLEKSPGVLIEILQNFGRVLDNGVDGTGGVGGGVSTIAVGIDVGVTPPPPPSESGAGQVQLADVLKAVLKLQRDLQALARKLPPAAVR